MILALDSKVAGVGARREKEIKGRLVVGKEASEFEVCRVLSDGRVCSIHTQSLRARMHACGGAAHASSRDPCTCCLCVLAPSLVSSIGLCTSAQDHNFQPGSAKPCISPHACFDSFSLPFTDFTQRKEI